MQCTGPVMEHYLLSLASAAVPVARNDITLTWHHYILPADKSKLGAIFRGSPENPNSLYISSYWWDLFELKKRVQGIMRARSTWGEFPQQT